MPKPPPSPACPNCDAPLAAGACPSCGFAEPRAAAGAHLRCSVPDCQNPGSLSLGGGPFVCRAHFPGRGALERLDKLPDAYLAAKNALRAYKGRFRVDFEAVAEREAIAAESELVPPPADPAAQHSAAVRAIGIARQAKAERIRRDKGKPHGR